MSQRRSLVTSAPHSVRGRTDVGSLLCCVLTLGSESLGSLGSESLGSLGSESLGSLGSESPPEA